MYLASAVFCQVQIYATGRSLIHRSPTERAVPECDTKTSTMKKPVPNGAVEP